jgi:hypothetical protein
MGMRNLAARVQRMFGERLGLRGNFGRLPEVQTYELTTEEAAVISLAGKPDLHPVMVRTRQNAAWHNIARARRIDVRTIKPHPEKGYPYFTAQPIPEDERDGGTIILDVVGPK